MSEAKVEDIETKADEVSEVKMEEAVKTEPNDESKSNDIVKSEDVKSEDVKSEDVKMENASPESKKKPWSATYEEGDLAGVLKTSAQHDEEDYKLNNKYDPSVLPESNDPTEIRNQVFPTAPI